MSYVIGGIVSLLAMLLGWLIRHQFERKGLVRTESEKLHLEHKGAPSDLLHFVAPGISVEGVKSRLGAPFAESCNQCQYKFSNLHLEIFSEDKKSVDAVTLVLPSIKKADLFEIPPLGFEFGRIRLGDIFGDGDVVQRSTSSKHGQVVVEKYYGNPGYYRYYTFGVFDGPSAPYDLNLHSGDTILNADPSQLRVNLLTIASTAHRGWGGVFDFYVFR